MMRKKFLAGFSATAFATILSVISLVSPSYAAGANMYLSSSDTTVNTGQTLAVGVHVNSGSESINAVQANLSYSADKLDFVSISPASTFPVESQASGGNGTVHIGRGIIGSVSGDKLIATVTFKAKAVGTAEVNFAADSSATDSSTNKPVTVSTVGASYTVSDGTSSSQSGNTHDKIPPKISAIKVSGINYRSVDISWKTSEPAQSEINYGSTNAYGITSVDTRYVTDHSMTISSEAVMPAATYHFKITDKDPAGNVSTSADGTFTTKGSVVIVNVVGKSKRAVKDATVTIDNSISQKTNGNGQVTFTNLKAGYHSITASWKDKSSSSNVTTVIPQNQPASDTIKLDVSQISKPMALLIAVILAALAVILANRLKKSKKSLKDETSVDKPVAEVHKPSSKTTHKSKKKS